MGCWPKAKGAGAALIICWHEPWHPNERDFTEGDDYAASAS